MSKDFKYNVGDIVKNTSDSWSSGYSNSCDDYQEIGKVGIVVGRGKSDDEGKNSYEIKWSDGKGFCGKAEEQIEHFSPKPQETDIATILQEADKALLAGKPVVAHSCMRLAITELEIG